MYGGGATGYICPAVVGDICLLLPPDEPRAAIAVLAAAVAVGGIIVVFLGRKM